MPTSINLYTLKQHRISRFRYDLDLQITNPQTCYHLLDLLLDLKSEPVEKFGIISLNTKYKITGLHIRGQGSLESVTVEPREVFKAAMTNNAYAIIAFHNHPSGDPNPAPGTSPSLGVSRTWGSFWILDCSITLSSGKESISVWRRRS